MGGNLTVPPAMSSVTQDQQRAIEARGNVLVQAGAGAGKTSTLVERCVRWLLESPGNSVDQILMVTFTEAAAAEMRHRIREALTKALDQSLEPQHLTEQLGLLETAQISTLHGFCFRFVRQHFHLLGLDPQVSVLPQDEAILLAGEVISDLLDEHYAGALPESESVQELILSHGNGSDKSIRDLAFRIHRFAQTTSNPYAWFDTQRAILNQEAPAHWLVWLKESLPGWKDDGMQALRPHQGIPALAKCLKNLGSLRIDASDNGTPVAEDVMACSLHTCLTAIQEADGDNKLWLRKKTEARKPFADFFAEVKFLLSLILKSEDGVGFSFAPLAEDWSWSRNPLRVALLLAREFGRRFAEAKREMGVVDFHDLEQFALKLLIDPATNRPTDLARSWRTRFKLVFVDEYQDINGAQDAILCALAQEGDEANRFLVGDVKQSIYRFRLADPRIFQNYTRDWRTGVGQVIPLQDNFRSHEAILEFVNPLFAALMREEIGGVGFDSDAMLRFGNRPGRAALTREGDASAVTGAPLPARVQLHLRLKGAQDDREDPDAEPNANDSETNLAQLMDTEAEARIVAMQARQLRDGATPVWDKNTGGYRPLGWSDIVILLRARANKADTYARELTRAGIPVHAPRTGLLQSIEILDLLNLLKLLDNPLQDIETVAVLRSPLVGLTLDDLAIIRLASRGRFWTALRRFHQLNPVGRSGGDKSSACSSGAAGAVDSSRTELAAETNFAAENQRPASSEIIPSTECIVKVDQFLRSYARWRQLARRRSLSQCLEKILDDTHYDAWVLTLQNGVQRQANILKLLAWARQFDQLHRQGLFRFLELLKAHDEAEIDHEPATVEAADAVRIMTVHQSKGLEFPVVIAADLGKKFNLQSLRDDLILDDVYGLCGRVKPPSAGQSYPSLPFWLAGRRFRREALGEEMRILYVALTRACQLLLLTATATRKQVEEKWATASQSNRDILKSGGCLDWLGPWLSNATGDPLWHQRAEGAGPLIRWNIYTDTDLQRAATEISAPSGVDLPALAQLDESRMDALFKRLTWKYPFGPATTEPAKGSVSSLRRRQERETFEGSHRVFPDRGIGESRRRSGKLSAAELGTLHHTYLQFIELDHANDLGGLKAEAERLQDMAIFTPEEIGHLDLESIAAFWHSEVGQSILQHGKAVHREVPFTARFDTRELSDQLLRLGKPGESLNTAGNYQISHPAASPAVSGEIEGEFIVVQGVIDLAVIFPSEIWLLDFKTDAVGDGELEQKAEEYRSQIILYALALERIYRRPTTRRWLHFLSARETVDCGRG